MLRNVGMEKDLPVASEALISPVVLSCLLLLNASLLAASLHLFSSKSSHHKSWLLMPGTSQSCVCGPLAPLSLPVLLVRAFLFLFVVQRTSKIRNRNASSVQAPWSSSYWLQLSACVSLIAHRKTKKQQQKIKKQALPELSNGTPSFTNRYCYLVLCLSSQRWPEHVHMHVRFAHQSLPVFSCFCH